MTREEILSVANPILFNTDMVRAILDGRKSMMRRVVKPQPILYGLLDPNFDWSRIKRPYHPEDILYVRETWSEWTDGYVYRAWTSPFPQPGRYPDEFMTWHPSIHMPKEAARIFLRVTDVRVERLQDISNDDVLREGIKPKYYEPWLTDDKRRTPKYGRDENGRPYCCAFHEGNCLEGPCTNREAMEREWYKKLFSEVWNSTIKPSERDIYGWCASPWVWVIQFERVEAQNDL